MTPLHKKVIDSMIMDGGFDGNLARTIADAWNTYGRDAKQFLINYIKEIDYTPTTTYFVKIINRIGRMKAYSQEGWAANGTGNNFEAT